MNKKKLLIRSKNWVIFLPNVDKSDGEYERYISGLEDFSYAVFQRHNYLNVEMEHIHLLLKFSKPKDFLTVKKMFPNAHLKVAVFDFKDYFLDNIDIHEFGICDKGEIK